MVITSVSDCEQRKAPWLAAGAWTRRGLLCGACALGSVVYGCLVPTSLCSFVAAPWVCLGHWASPVGYCLSRNASQGTSPPLRRVWACEPSLVRQTFSPRNLNLEIRDIRMENDWGRSSSAMVSRKYCPFIPIISSRSQTFSVKGQLVNILGLVGFVPTPWLTAFPFYSVISLYIRLSKFFLLCNVLRICLCCLSPKKSTDAERVSWLMNKSSWCPTSTHQWGFPFLSSFYQHMEWQLRTINASVLVRNVKAWGVNKEKVYRKDGSQSDAWDKLKNRTLNLSVSQSYDLN